MTATRRISVDGRATGKPYANYTKRERIPAESNKRSIWQLCSAVIRPFSHSVVAVAVLSSCGWEDPTKPELKPAGEVLGSITASPLNAIIAVGGTIKIDVSGRTLNGAAVTTFDSVRYALVSIVDTLRVTLAADGTVTGKASSGATPVAVNVFAYKNGVGKADRAIVQVTAASIAGLTLSIQPAATDSAKLARGSTKVITPVIRNAALQAVATPALRLTARNQAGAVFAGYVPTILLPGDDGIIVSVGVPPVFTSYNTIAAVQGEGTSYIYAEVNAYGTLLQDSVLYTASYPYTGTIQVYTADRHGLQVRLNETSTPTATFAPGATITFRNGMLTTSALPMVFTFDTPASALAATPPSTTGGASGDVTSINPNQQTNRRFNTAGTVRYTATIGGNLPPYSGQTVTGTIIIK
jgi:hypothetical protein